MRSLPRESPGSFQSLRGNLNLLLFICRTWGTSLEVFLHRDIGERYLGWNAAAVLLLVPLYLLGWEHYDPRPMLLFLLAFLGMCFVARVGTFRRRLRGVQGHSLYTGWPHFLGPRAKWSELTMKRIVEPAVTFLLGCVIRDCWDAPLGTYLMIGAVCLFISVSVSEAVERIRCLDLNDVVIEQELTAERFNSFRGDR